MSTAFVAGATGYTGREVVAALVKRGARTVAHIRPDSPSLPQWQRRFTELGAEPDATSWDVDGMAATLARIEATHVFALLGTTRARARASAGDGQSADYRAVDLGLTMLLLEATQRAMRALGGGSPRFIYLSAIMVGPNAKGEYLRVRWEMEQALARSGVEHVIARPSFITGPDRDESRPLERASAALLEPVLALAGHLGARRFRDRYRATTAAELARALVRIAFDPAAPAQRIFESDALRDAP